MGRNVYYSGNNYGREPLHSWWAEEGQEFVEGEYGPYHPYAWEIEVQMDNARSWYIEAECGCFAIPVCEDIHH